MIRQITSEVDKICHNINNIENIIHDTHNHADDGTMRHLIDLRRQYKSDLKTHKARFKKELEQSSTTHLDPNIDVEQFVKNWCDRIKYTKNNSASLDDDEFCNLYIDHSLPDSWDFMNDIVVVIEPSSEQLIRCLARRGQRNILVLDEKRVVSDKLEIRNSETSILICRNLNDLEIGFVLLEAMSEQVITLNCAPCPIERKEAISMAIKNGKTNRLANTITAVRFGSSWTDNVIKNLSKISEIPNLHQMNVQDTPSAIIVASGPSLEKNVDMLHKLQDSVFVVSAFRSLPILKSVGVVPDLVIQLDAEDEEAAKFAVSQDFRVKNLLLELTVNTKFFDIKADQKFWSLSRLFYDIHDHFGTKPTPFDSPSVSIYSLLLCLHLGFKNICFIGQDLAACGSQQYALESSPILPQHHDISSFNISTPGFNGGCVKTRSAYFQQIKRCTSIARQVSEISKDVNLINATEGGAFIDGFNHMKLKDFKKRYLSKSISPSKKLHVCNKSLPSKQDINSYNQKAISNLRKINLLSKKVITLTSDRQKSTASSKKAEELIQNFKSLNAKTSYLQLSMQEEISRTTGSSIDGTAIRSNEELFTQVRDRAQILIDNINRTQERPLIMNLE